MRSAICVLILVTAASAAEAQESYVGASLIGDVVRMSGSGSGSDGGEAFGFALRLGAPLGERWGVELEFARSGEMDISPDVGIAADFATQSVGRALGMGGAAGTLVFPMPQFEVQRQLSTISTMVWWEQELSERVDLAYLGGVAFTRAAWHSRVSYPGFPGGIPAFPAGPIVRPPQIIDSDSVMYGADVAVGLEGRVDMTEHVRLAPGIRMQTVEGGWAIRPGVGLQWRF
jgi:hypothetical protein